jgi:hypothetical protein
MGPCRLFPGVASFISGEQMTTAIQTEFLAASGAVNDQFDPVVCIALRTDPRSFKPTNLVFTAEAAERMLHELESALNSPAVLGTRDGDL